MTNTGVWLLLMVVLAGMIIGGMYLSGSVPTASPSLPQEEALRPDTVSSHSYTHNTSSTEYHGECLNLHGRVIFNGFEFVITNNDDFVWVNVELDLNGGLFSRGYVYRISRIPPGTWHIDATNFAKRSGERFNPFTTKPLRLEIITYLDDGTMSGFGAVEWQ